MKVIFNKGIPGFEHIKEYELDKLESNPLFWELSSIEDKQIGFVTVSPFEVDNKYEIDLPDSIVKELEIDSPDKVMIINILTLGRSLEETSVNLKAPIIINVNNGLGKQVILQNEKYKIKTPLLRSEK